MRNFSKQIHDVYFLRGTRNTEGARSGCQTSVHVTCGSIHRIAVSEANNV